MVYRRGEMRMAERWAVVVLNMATAILTARLTNGEYIVYIEYIDVYKLVETPDRNDSFHCSGVTSKLVHPYLSPVDYIS